MKLRNKNGFSLIEIVMALMIVGIVTTLVSSLFIFGLQSYNTTTRQIHQHDIVTEITRRISKDIQEASSYCVVYQVTPGAINSYTELYLQFPTSSGIISTSSASNWKCYRLQQGKLSLAVGSQNVYTESDYAAHHQYRDILTNIDTGEYEDTPGNTTLLSKFQTVGGTLMLFIKPKSTNTSIHRNKNFIKPIISEYSVKYKDTFTVNPNH